MGKSWSDLTDLQAGESWLCLAIDLDLLCRRATVGWPLELLRPAWRPPGAAPSDP
jgi:hypothetical protein